MSSLIKKQIPIVLVFITALFPLMDFFITTETTVISSVTNQMQTLGSAIFAFAVFVVSINLWLAYGKNVYKRQKGTWYYSAWTLAAFAIFVVAGFFPGYDWQKSPYFSWIYQNMYFTVSQAMMGILAFAIVGGAIRSFRVRTVEATVLFLAAMFVWMSTAPIGAVIHPMLPAIGDWFIAVPNTAANRGLMLCVGIGTIALGLRQMSGIERAYLGIEE